MKITTDTINYLLLKDRKSETDVEHIVGSDLGLMLTHICEGTQDDRFQLVEFNVSEGYSIDITEHVFHRMMAPSIVGEFTFEDGYIGWTRAEPVYEDPNAEHKADWRASR